MPDEWINDHSELATVLRMLIDANVLWPGSGREGDGPVDFVEKPWKWSNVRDLWIAAGRPVEGDPGWDPFRARIDRALDGS